MLAEIKTFLKTNGPRSLPQLANQFNMQANALQPMLTLLVRKGQLRLCQKTPRCGTQCNQCSLMQTQIYEWIE